MFSIIALIMICSGLIGNYEKQAEMTCSPTMVVTDGMKFRQFCDVKTGFGKNKGESLNWLQCSNVSSYGGALSETQTMHETTQPMAYGTLTVNEYGLKAA